MTTYYVAKTGNDNNSGTSAAPRLTIAAGAALLASGDTLTIRPGVYTESIGHFNTVQIPNGLNTSSYTIVQAETYGTVTLRPSTYSPNGVIVHDTGEQYIGYKGLVIDAINGTVVNNAVAYGNGTNNCYMEDCEIVNAPGNGIACDIGNGGTFDIRFTRLVIHNCGAQDPSIFGYPPGSYGIYLPGLRYIVENCEIYDTTGWGIHAYGESPHVVSGHIIRNNYIHDIYNPSIGRTNDDGGGGILYWSIGGNAQIYNNVIILGNARTSGVCHGMALSRGGGINYCVNNTIYGLPQHPYGFRIGDGTSGWRVQGNIIRNFGTTGFSVDGTNTNTILTPNYTNDPQFINVATRDLHIATTSPAAGTGIFYSFVTTDKDSRTRTNPPASGAYEPGGTIPPPDPIPRVFRAWYTFETGVGSLVSDISGENNNGTLSTNTGTLPTWVTPGRLGRYGLAFAGVKDYVQTTLNTTISQMTIMCTVYAQNAITGNPTAIPILFIFSDGISEISFNWDNTDSNFQRSWVIGSNGVYVPCKYVTALANQTYYRLLMTYDSSTVRIYLNGVLEASVSANPPVGTCTHLILSAYGSAGDWQGRLDEFRLENYIFTQAEITYDFLRTFNPPIGDPPSHRPFFITR